jgi:hypothetical protein
MNAITAVLFHTAHRNRLDPWASWTRRTPGIARS